MKGFLPALFLFVLLTGSAQAAEESVYDRVMKSGKIRCAYGVWEPIILKDPNTGIISGIFYDYLEALGEELGLEIEWSEEVSWSDWPVGLQHDRFDAACIGIWPLAKRARDMDFTIPIYYHAMRAYVRADDTRFDGNIQAANDETVTFGTQDGTVDQPLIGRLFPKAKILSLPQMAPQTDIFLNVVSGRADITISDQITAEMYMANNPGKIRPVEGIEPVSYFGNTIAVKAGEDKFRRLLDNATRDLINRGVIGQIVDKYEKYPGSLLPVARPYENYE